MKGDKVQLRYNEDTKTLEWKYEDADEWIELMDINALHGEVVTEVLEQATAAKEAAESAKTAAEAARDSAVTASETAVSAKETAVSAKNGAEAAAGNASDSAGEAAASAELAGQKAAAAEKSAEAAAASAASIGQAEENAAASATEAESWAVGGTGTREGEDTNNAKYWSARAQDAAGGGVTSFNNRTGAVRPVKGDYTADLVTFTDGQTFQEKYDSGELTGPAGADGAPGQQGQPGADGDPGPAGQDGADGKDATINGVNALTLAASGGLNGSQSGSTYTIDGSGKQDKLTGTAGQVVGFDAEGNAIPQAAPSGLPEGGTVGQLLEKTEGGAEWADKPVMYVNITPPAGDSPFGTADHTIAEITQAVLNGVTVLSKISAGTDTKVIPLSTVTDSVASFSSTSVDYGGSVIANIVPQEQSEVVIIAEDQFRASQILYDKGTSGLDSDDVQGAIKELAKNKQDSADAVTVSGGGTMQMGESLGDGPYTIEVTEDGEGGDLSAEYVGYSNTGSGLEATNVQGAIDELAGRGSSGVITFNGRSGAVVPQEGDYTANMVGALPNSTKLADLPADESHRTVSDTEKSAWNSKGDPAKSTTITLLSSGWTQGGDGRYSQTVACSIVAADTAVVSVDVALSGTDLDADAEALNAWMGPSAQNAVQGAGTLTFYAAEAPTVNIPVNVGVG